MATRKIWLIEEIDLDGGEIGHRQSLATYTEDESDGSWMWDAPEGRLTEQEMTEWQRVMALLSDVNGEDLRHVICAVGLMDHCHDSADTEIDQYGE